MAGTINPSNFTEAQPGCIQGVANKTTLQWDSDLKREGICAGIGEYEPVPNRTEEATVLARGN
eukprot:6180493-Pleurochrysis_carterae.AAC.2